MPRPEKFTTQIKVWLAPSQAARLRMRAASDGTTANDVVRAALARYLAEPDENRESA